MTTTPNTLSTTSFPQSGTIPLPSKSAQELRAESAAQDFEAMFISEMIKPMFEDIETDGMFGGGKGEEVFRGLLIQEFGKNIARQGGLGLSDQVRESLLKIQEQQSIQQ